VLVHAEIGYQLTHAGEPIAEVIHKYPSQIEIKDRNNKHWLINLNHLKHIDFSAFLEDLAQAIMQYNQSQPKPNSARDVLSNLSVGAQLGDAEQAVVTLAQIEPPKDGCSLTLVFTDARGQCYNVDLDKVPPELTIEDFTQRLKTETEQDAIVPTEPVLLRYFQEEFIPKMLAQMALDQNRYGDTWLMDYTEGLETHIRERFDDYFSLFDQFEKPIPWLKIAGYAILAQARLDHPEWLLND
ncbi:MAG: hypothetical protein GX142_10175, partial [Chloroflexi bacterium]|nr:hypothetical protein [Chloroflexota bacterium]